MRSKILAALALGGSVLAFQASALAAQDTVTKHHRSMRVPHSQQQTQPAPQYYDYYYDQSRGPNAVGAAGSALGGLGR